MNLNEFLFNLVVLWLGSELKHYCVYFELFHIEAFFVYFSGFQSTVTIYQLLLSGSGALRTELSQKLSYRIQLLISIMLLIILYLKYYKMLTIKKLKYYNFRKLARCKKKCKEENNIALEMRLIYNFMCFPSEFFLCMYTSEIF